MSALPPPVLGCILRRLLLDARARLAATCRRLHDAIGDAVPMSVATAALGAGRVSTEEATSVHSTWGGWDEQGAKRRRLAASGGEVPEWKVVDVYMYRSGVAAQGRATLRALGLVAARAEDAALHRTLRSCLLDKVAHDEREAARRRQRSCHNSRGGDTMETFFCVARQTAEGPAPVHVCA